MLMNGDDAESPVFQTDGQTERTAGIKTDANIYKAKTVKIDA